MTAPYIPSGLPLLRKGAGKSPKNGGCLVEVAGFLYDGMTWSDKAQCVANVLRPVSIYVNDEVSDGARPRLALAAGRLSGSAHHTTDMTPSARLVLALQLFDVALGQAERSDPANAPGWGEIRLKAQGLCRAVGSGASAPEPWTTAFMVSSFDGPLLRAAAHLWDVWEAIYGATLRYSLIEEIEEAVGFAIAIARELDECGRGLAAVPDEASHALIDDYFELLDEFDWLTGRESKSLTTEQIDAIVKHSPAMAGGTS